MTDYMRAELVRDPLRMAIQNRQPCAGCDVPLRPRHAIVEVFFNRRRPHSSLGYCTPAAYENNNTNTNTNTAHAA
jgi:transposase InsO family protein